MVAAFDDDDQRWVLCQRYKVRADGNSGLASKSFGDSAGCESDAFVFCTGSAHRNREGIVDDNRAGLNGDVGGPRHQCELIRGELWLSPKIVCRAHGQ